MSETTTSYFRQLSKDTLIYGVGGFVSQLGSLGVLLVATRLLSPAEYGQVDLLTTLAVLTGSMVSLGTDSALSYLFFEQQATSVGQARLITGALQFRLCWGPIVAAGMWIGFPLLSQPLFRGDVSVRTFGLALVYALALQVCTQSAEVYRLLFRPWGFIAVSVSQTLLGGALALSAVGLGHRVEGYFAGQAGGVLVVAVAAWIFLSRDLPLGGWQIGRWPELLKLGAPLVPAVLAAYLLANLDRWAVAQALGPDQVGLYAVGARVAAVLGLLVATVRQAWWPLAMQALQSEEDARPLFRAMSSRFLGSGVVLILILSAVAPTLLGWIARPAYHDAWPLVGLLAWTTLFNGMYMILSVGSFKVKRTGLNSWVLCGAVALLCILLHVLIPMYGLVGAAMAAALAHLAWAVGTLTANERVWPVGYPVARLGALVLLGGAASTLIRAAWAKGSAGEVTIALLLALPLCAGLSLPRRAPA